MEREAGELRQKERDAGTRRENAGRELARLQERKENLQRDYDNIASRLWEEYELTRREAEEVGQKIEDLSAAQRRLSELKNKIRALGTVNVGAVEEYREVSERYEFLKAQVEDVEKSKAELLGLIQDLTKQMRRQFTRALRPDQRKLREDLPGAVRGRGRGALLYRRQRRAVLGH